MLNIEDIKFDPVVKMAFEAAKKQDEIESKALAITLIMKVGSYDGAHHKQWVLDQVLRLLAGDAYESIIDLWCHYDQEGKKYLAEDCNEWDEGIAP